MKVLKEILYKVTLEKIIGNTTVVINNLHFDSRKVSLNDVFVAISGTVADGHKYIEKATFSGALVIVCEQLPDNLVNGITYVVVPDSREALAIMAANFYDNPSEDLSLVGITGTNGKTTIATLLYELVKKAGYNAGLLSTVKIMVDNTTYEAHLTTPDSLTINKYLRAMVDAGADYCFMEVSSHGIDQKRTKGLRFAGGVFTNLSHDHLDYHKDFKSYRDVKKQFFDDLDKNAFALVNADDKNGIIMLQNTKATKKTYALKTIADFKGHVIESQMNGQLLRINQQEVWVKLIGRFNAYNLLAIYGTAKLLGLDSLEILQLLSTLESVGGRFQYFISHSGVIAIVDYAHTPDALKNVLETINSIRSGKEELLTVIGCGGDRDAGKRPVMGKIAATLSDKVFFTSDNPRTENPETIINQMEEGVPQNMADRVMSIVNRREAIKVASKMAKKHDIILIAGKGHETYQEINGERFDFDDYKIVSEFLNPKEH